MKNLRYVLLVVVFDYLLISNLWLVLVPYSLFLFWFLSKQHYTKGFYLGIILIVLSYLSFYVKLPIFSNIYLVFKHKSYGSQLLSLSQRGSFLLYNDENLPLFSIIRISDVASAISSTCNFRIFNYVDYARNHHLLGFFNNGVSFQKIFNFKLYSYLDQYILRNSSNTLKYYLDYIDSQELAYAVLISSGLHFHFLITFVDQLGGMLFHRENRRRLNIFFRWLLVILFPTSLQIYRILLLDYLKGKGMNYFQRILYYVMIFLILDPYYLLDLRFLIPLLFYIFNPFLKKDSFLSIKVMTPIYFVNNSYISFFEIFMFPILRIVYGILLLIAIIALPLPFLNGFIDESFLAIEAVLLFLKQQRFYLLVGKMNFLIALIYYLILGFKKRMLYLVGFLLIWNVLLQYKPYNYILLQDVGQGDSVFIEYSFNKGTVMIDTGGSLAKDIASDVLIPQLLSLGNRKIDYLFITHDDYDHSGASESLLANFKVKNVIKEQADKEYHFGLDAFIKQVKMKETTNSNDNSLILLLNLNDFKFLFAGDASKEIENTLMRKHLIEEVDVFKLSHHGAKTSNSKAFLHYLNPSFVVNSSGINNRYGHPSSETIDNLNSLKIPYFDTQIEGAIEFYIFKKFLLIHTYSNKWIFLKKG